MTDEKAAKARDYRQRAAQIIAEAHKAQSEEGKRAIFELANIWLDLAHRAEEAENL